MLSTVSKIRGSKQLNHISIPNKQGPELRMKVKIRNWRHIWEAGCLNFRPNDFSFHGYINRCTWFTGEQSSGY